MRAAFTSWFVGLLTMGAFELGETRTCAAPIPYGDVVASQVTYRTVTEDSSTDPLPPAMYGAPSVSGNSLNFSPSGFDASSTGGSVADTTTGQLFYVIEVNNKQTQSIPSFQINETGNLTMAGNVPVGSDDTSTNVNIDAVVEIVEVDGAALAVPIELKNANGPPLKLTPTFALQPGNTPSDGTWQLGVDGGGGPTYSTQWSAALPVDLQAALVSTGTPFVRGATKVNVNMNNVLVATSEVGTNATIVKTGTLGVATVVRVIPEPTAFILTIVGLFAGAASRRR
jgi:hypothetical protein